MTRLHLAARIMSAAALITAATALPHGVSAAAQERVAENPFTQSPTGYEPYQGAFAGWVNFEPELERGIRRGAQVGEAYAGRAGGVRFIAEAGGVVLEECGFDLNTPSRCRYPASEGRHAAFAPGSSLTLRFDQRAALAAFALSPGRPGPNGAGEAAVFQVTALINGDPITRVRVEAQSFEDNGEGWARVQIPAQATANEFPPDRFNEIRIEALDVQGAPARAGIVIDAFRFLRNAARETRDTGPFAGLGPRAGLDGAFDRTARIRDVFMGSRQVQAQQIPPGGRFAVPERRRVRVDVAAALIDGQRQRSQAGVSVPMELGVEAAKPVGLPILAPLSALADPEAGRGLVDGADLVADADSFHLYVPTEHGSAVIRGSRVLTLTPQAGRTPGRLRISFNQYGAMASFNLYGAAYGVEIACEPSQLICSDRDAVRDFIDRLFIFVGEAR